MAAQYLQLRCTPPLINFGLLSSADDVRVITYLRALYEEIASHDHQDTKSRDWHSNLGFSFADNRTRSSVAARATYLHSVVVCYCRYCLCRARSCKTSFPTSLYKPNNQRLHQPHSVASQLLRPFESCGTNECLGEEKWKEEKFGNYGNNRKWESREFRECRENFLRLSKLTKLLKHPIIPSTPIISHNSHY